jgi:Protein of unknown function (DUF4058)
MFWDGFLGQWPGMIVLKLSDSLPKGYAASPRVRLGPDNEYEVLVHDRDREGKVAAAVEIVSPESKDKPERRRIFATRCAALLQQRVSVVIIDVVTVRQFNLYADLLGLIGRTDPSLGQEPSGIYVASCRWTEAGKRGILERWAHPLTLGQPLPTLPLWLADDLPIPLELEKSYEETCRVLRIV